jgi:glutaminyl-peptide cyclotransferase
VLCLLAAFPAHGAGSNGDWPDIEGELCEAAQTLVFNGTLANESVQWQVDLGPRVPESNASATLRAQLRSMLEPWGYEVTETVHHRHGMNLTNLEARWASPTPNATQLVLSAHYDSRNIADHDANASNRTQPVPGANDGASGVAVLIELAKAVATMSFNHDIVFFFNDAEDQNENFTVGAEAWAENLSAQEIQRTEAFVLLDMVGDADLQLRNINPGNDTLKGRIVELGKALGMVEGETDCRGNTGLDIVQYDVQVGVLDDHYHAHVRGIPSVDLMDPQYGEAKPMTFGSYWHTLEDTPDKVSAASLERVGRLVELGLRTDAFVGLLEPATESPAANQSESSNDSLHQNTSDPQRAEPNLAPFAAITLVLVLVALAVVEWKGKP